MEAKEINYAAMPQMAVRIVTAPAEFFREMPKTGGFLEPLVFSGVMGLAASIIQAIWSLLGFGYGGQAQSGLASIFLSIIYMPVIFAISSFIGAAIVFYIWKLMRSTENYEVSYRCMAYLMALAAHYRNNKSSSLCRYNFIFCHCHFLYSYCQHGSARHTRAESFAGLRDNWRGINCVIALFGIFSQKQV
jgi:hypothetical protein